MKNYIAIILFLSLFLIESFIGRVFTYSFDLNCEDLAGQQMGEWVSYMQFYCTKTAVFALIMWASLPLLHVFKIKLDLWDWLFLAACWSTELVTVIDWVKNGNTREENYDWLVYTPIFILLILLKIKTYGITNKRRGIY